MRYINDFFVCFLKREKKMFRPRRNAAAAAAAQQQQEPLLIGRRVEAVNEYYRMSWYNVALITGCFALFSILLIGITLSLTLPSPEARFVPPTFLQRTSSSSSSATSTFTGNATTVVTTTATTAAPATTTTAPTMGPLAITCPTDITVTLGSSLTPPISANASGGGCAPIIIQYADNASFSSMKKRKKVVAAGKVVRSGSIQGHAMRSLIVASNERPLPTRRSPSFNANNIALQGSVVLYPFPVNEGNAVVAANGQYVILLTAEGNALISNSNNTVQLTAFSVDNLSPVGSVCSRTNNTFAAESQLIWDEASQRWLFFRIATNRTGLCLHVTSDPLALPFTTFFYDMHIVSRVQTGLWTRVYALSFVNNQSRSSLCVMDKTNLTSVFCSTSFLNNAPHAWSPVDAQPGPLPPLGGSENANSPNAQNPGALFMRSVDDEFYSNASTPTTDSIEVEHWYNINFTLSTYNTLRYSVVTRDFDDSTGNCSSYPACVSTPTATKLNVVRGAYKFNYRAENIVTSLTSNSGKSVYWFHMKWQQPNIATPERWTLQQDQALSSAVASDFMFAPGIQMDVNGTIVLAYTISSNITYPSLYASSRLANDPLGQLRSKFLLAAGSAGSLFAAASQWSNAASLAIDPRQSRIFLISGLSSSMPPQNFNLNVARVRILGESIQRVWTATDACSTHVNCTQLITAI
ncbi:MAG: hypothetical protein K2Q45_00410 [Nitrosomonas sp.]|nr:hypothetical protein [Nitrosomonas sp.]